MEFKAILVPQTIFIDGLSVSSCPINCFKYHHIVPLVRLSPRMSAVLFPVVGISCYISHNVLAEGIVYGLHSISVFLFHTVFRKIVSTLQPSTAICNAEQLLYRPPQPCNTSPSFLCTNCAFHLILNRVYGLFCIPNISL